MKRILAILLVVVVITAMTVPAFAANSQNMQYGEHKLPNISSYWSESNTNLHASIFKMDNGEYHLYVSNKPISYDAGSSSVVVVYNYTKYTFSQGGTSWSTGRTYTSGQIMIGISALVWCSSDLGYNDGSNYVTVYETVPIIDPNICDGSSCPATDRNFDDVCDDCGMTLAYGLRVTPTTYEFIIKHSDSLTLKYTYTETIADTVINAVYDDDRITVSFDNPMDHYQYKLVGDEWEEYASYPNTYGSHAMSLLDTSLILSADIVVYDVNGDVFFRNPLWMVTEQVTQGEMENLTMKTAGTMKILVVCGVGLMACLMVLKLFGKKSLISLKR